MLGLRGPVRAPFVVAARRGWLGDPLVDRLQRAGRSRNTAAVLLFALMALLLALALLILVPTLQRQIATLVQSLPNYRDWFVDTAIPWVDPRDRTRAGQGRRFAVHVVPGGRRLIKKNTGTPNKY